MKHYLLKASGVAALALLLQNSIMAQDIAVPPPPPKPGPEKIQKEEEIVIRRKNDKDVKVTVEIKDGQVFINGKPADEFSNEDIEVRKNVIPSPDVLALVEPDMPMRSPFRGGVRSFDMDQLMDLSKLGFLGVASENTDGHGAKIREVTKGSGAEKAGLKAGDIITQVNDQKISNPQELTKAIHQFKPEDKVNITYTRDGKEQQTTATLGKNSAMTIQRNFNFRMPRMQDFRELQELGGMRGPNAFFFNDDNRPKLGIKAQDTEDGKGVKVLDVDNESPADKAGVKEGDIITHFDGKPVNSAESLVNLARETKNKTSVKISLSRDGKSKEIEIKIPKKLNTADL